MEKDYTSLVDRIDSLEKKLEKGVVMASANAGRPGVAGGSAPAEGNAPAAKAELPKAVPEDIRQVIGSWSGIISQLTGVTRTYLKKAVRSLGANGALLLVFDDPNAYAYLESNRSECQTELKEAVADRIGKEIEIQLKLNDSGQPGDEIYPDLGQLIQFEIEEEDF